MTQEHVTSPLTYAIIFVVLLLLVWATWGAAQFDVGPWNIVIALGIAGIKTLLIVLFFMHLLHSVPLVKFFALAGVVWLAIGGLLTFADYWTRGWDTPMDQVILPRASDRAAPDDETFAPAATFSREPGTAQREEEQ